MSKKGLPLSGLLDDIGRIFLERGTAMSEIHVPENPTIRSGQPWVIHGVEPEKWTISVPQIMSEADGKDAPNP